MKVGDMVAGRFELREVIGGDEQGQVFRAFDDRDLREVSLKVFDAARCPAEAVRRYGALVTSAARARHPAIGLPRVEGAIHGAPPLAISDLFAGEDLDALRERVGVLPWRRAAQIVATCAEALADLAAATGAAHRALRPGSVRVGENDGLQILDFGIAELGVRPAAPRGDTHVEYRAPEQLEGGLGDARSDVFTLGVLLFEMATGVHPFSGPSTFKVMHKVLLQAAPRPSEVCPGVPLPGSIEALLARALARRPADRFADPAELAKVLALVRRAPDGERALMPLPGPVPSVVDEGTDSTSTAASSTEDMATVLSLPSSARSSSPAQQPATPPKTPGAAQAPSVAKEAPKAAAVPGVPSGFDEPLRAALVGPDESLNTAPLPSAMGGSDGVHGRWPLRAPDELEVVMSRASSPSQVESTVALVAPGDLSAFEDEETTHELPSPPARLPEPGSAPGAVPGPASAPDASRELPTMALPTGTQTGRPARAGASSALKILVALNIVFLLLAGVGLAWFILS